MSSNRFNGLLALFVIILLLSGSSHAAASSGPTSDQPASPASKQQSRPQVADPPAWHNDYPSYNSVKMTSATAGWVVGSSGTIKRYYNNNWGDYLSPVTNTLTTVDAHAGDTWAGGADNTLIHLVGSDWVRFSSPAPLTVTITNLKVVAAGEAWAIADLGSDYGVARPNLLLHFNGASWAIASTPGISSTAHLSQMSWLSPTDGWAVADNIGNVAFHYQSGTWTAAALPPQAAGDYRQGATSIYMRAANEGWIGLYDSRIFLANRTTLAPELSPGSSIIHYTGTWTLADTAAAPEGAGGYATVSSNDLTSFASNDYFASQTFDNDSDLQYYLIHNSAVISRTATPMLSLSGVAANDFWAAACDGIYHWDGSNLSRVVASGSTYGTKIQMLAANDGWLAQGGYGNVHRLYHYTGTTWLPVTSTRAKTFAFAAPNDGWAYAGEVGSPDHYFSHYDGSTWHQTQVLTDRYLFDDMQMLTGTNGWAVGSYMDFNAKEDDAAVAHYSGGSWQVYTLTGGLNHVLKAVSFDSPTDGWAVGNCVYGGSPIIFHYNGTSWLEVSVPVTNTNLAAIYAVAPNDVWAVGGEYYASTSMLLHWNGSDWTVTTVPLARLNTIKMLSSTEGWAGGTGEYYASAGPLLHYTGGSWQPVNNPGGSIYSLSFTSPTDGWAVGNAGPIHYYSQCLDYYADVPAGYFAAGPIRYLSCAGIVAGTGNHIFSPNANATRAQFAKMISLARGWTIVNPTTPTFSDVPTSNFLYRYIETAAVNGAVTGYAQAAQCGAATPPCFKPNDQISRGQTAIIVVRAFGWATNVTGGPHFSDVPASSFFYDAVETAYNRGVVNGTDPSHFAPNSNVTRGQISKMLYLGLID